MKMQLGSTRHDLEFIESVLFEAGDGIIRSALLMWGPVVDEFQDVDSGRVWGFDAVILVVAEDSFVHGDEIDDGDSECAVHVKNNASEARFGGGVCHSVGRGGKPLSKRTMASIKKIVELLSIG